MISTSCILRLSVFFFSHENFSQINFNKSDSLFSFCLKFFTTIGFPEYPVAVHLNHVEYPQFFLLSFSLCLLHKLRYYYFLNVYTSLCSYKFMFFESFGVSSVWDRFPCNISLITYGFFSILTLSSFSFHCFVS